LPNWLAVMLHGPTATKPKLLPLTVHTVGVVDTRLTVKPELAEATSAAGGVPNVALAGALKLMLCGASAATTEKDCETGAAAAKLMLPGWLAVKLQVPADTSTRVLPVALHTLGVVDAITTGKADVALANNGAGAVPKRCGPGGANVMLWAVGKTTMLINTGAAPAKTKSPDWLATTMQLPAPNSVKSGVVVVGDSGVVVLPLTLQSAVVVETNDTTKPDDALATKGSGAAPSVGLAGTLKLMVWAAIAAAITNEFDTAAAAA
jgi:hypothetical protein